MPNFTLVSSVTVSASTVVEADSLDEAIEIAKDRSVELSTGYDPAFHQQMECWVIDEADGEALDIREE